MKITRFEDIEAWKASRRLLGQIEELKSATEIQSHLYGVLDQGAITQSEFDRIYGGAEDLKKLIGGFVRYLTDAKKTPRLRTGD
ncbi:MAG TPA: hypothetical protein VMQ61_18770 [Thermoanaerobaculia bacterium]|nr:hypothetical protein [Thermoanaerobaculia bacterium]